MINIVKSDNASTALALGGCAMVFYSAFVNLFFYSFNYLLNYCILLKYPSIVFPLYLAANNNNICKIKQKLENLNKHFT